MAGTWAFPLRETLSADGANSSLFDAPTDYLANPSEVAFTDTVDHQVMVGVAANGSYSTDRSAFTEGSLLPGTDPSGHTVAATGNAVASDSSLQPSLSVDATNPADVTFTVSDVPSGYSGTVTFTDASGKQDVVPVQSDGTYSTNLSNLSDGTISYLLSVKNAAGNVITVDPTATLGDGSANAPAGTPEVPNLLSGYAVRPSWEVAGVDYYVGVPAGTVLKNPNTINMAGVSINTSNDTVNITGNNITLSGYDFSLNGGWQVFVAGNNDTIEDCNFAVGSNGQPPITVGFNAQRVLVSASNTTIEYNTINGNGISTTGNGGVGLINDCGIGTSTIEYNSLTNAYNVGIVLGNNLSSAANYVVQYNLVENTGLGSPQGAHGDWIQAWNVAGDTSSIEINYNTLVQNAGAAAGIGTQGLSLQSASIQQGPVLSETVENNTMIATSSGAINRAVIVDTSNLDGSATVANNYIDPTGIQFGDTWDFIGQYNNGVPTATGDGLYNGTVTTSNNINMVTGVAYPQSASLTEVTQVVSSPSTGNEVPGNAITFTLDFNAAVTVTGTPTLSLNDGGTATYKSGSGTNQLAFTYSVGSSDSSVTALAITSVNLPSGASITDGNGNAALMTGADVSFSGLSVSTAPTTPTTPTIVSIQESPSSGDLNAGKTVTLTLLMGQAMTVTGTPTLTLNDGGTATYSSGSGTNTLAFTYAVAAGQNTSALAITSVNLPAGAKITNGSGTAAGLSLTGLTQTGPQIDTTAPAAPVISGDTVNVNTVTLNGTAAANSTITVFDNSTQLGTATTNSSGAWTYTTGALANGSQSFTATATDGAGNVSAASSALAMTLTAPVNLVTNGNFATGTLSGWTLGGNYYSTAFPLPRGEIYIDNNPEGGSTYAVGVGSVGSDGTLSQTIATTPGQTYTLSFWLQNEGSGPNDFAAMWNGQTLLALTNAAASGYTEYTYTVTATSSSTVLEFSARQDPSQWDLDNISLTANGTANGTPAATVSSIAESPSSGDLNAGKAVTLTLNMSGAVTVAGGTPTLSLNDGGTATYTGGSGSSALTFSYTVAAGQNTASLAATAVNLNGATVTNGGNAANLSLSGLTQSGPQIDTTTPTISAIGEVPSSGDLSAGKTVTYTLTLSEAVTVNTSAGSPTLSLNDGGTATYVSGSGTNALTFLYTVLAGQNTPDLTVMAVNLNGGTIADGVGNAANLSLTGIAQGSPQVDTTPPVISSMTESPSGGALNVGGVATLTLKMSEAVTVAGGTPTLSLNDGGTATYTGGSGSSALTFSYTVASGQNTASLAATAVNLNSASITDGAGNAASLSLSGLTQTGPQIDTTAPAAPVISGDTVNVNTVTLNGTAAANSTITVFDNSTQLGTATTNSSGAWTYTTGALANGSQSFTATATDGAGNVSAASSALAMTLTAPVNLVTNGNFATGTLSGWTLGGNYYSTAFPLPRGEIYIDNNPEGGSTYAVGVGSVGSDGTLSQTIATTPGQTYTLSFWLQNEGSGPNDFAAMWNGQTLLALTNAAASGYTEYTYTVTATSSSTVLEFSARQDPSQWDLDNISLTANGTANGTPAATVSSIAESPSSGDLNAGKAVTLTLNMSGAVTVAGGTPTLSLNDGGTATYTGGSGSSALTFSYTVAAGQNTASLAATAVNLNGATVTNGGNAANLSLSGLTQSGPQIDTTTPTISAIGEVPSSGDLSAGKTVTYTLTLSEAVTVNTSAGTPTLSLNDGGTASYVSGSGTNALTFLYTVLAGQNTPDLTVMAVNLNGGTIADGVGNAANLSLTGIAQGSPQVDTTPPVISSMTESPSGGALNVGGVATLTLKMSEAVTVAGGTPTLSLNDGGTATYTGGSGSSALTFSYTVAAGQNTASLAATAVNLNSASITDGAGNAASLSLSGLTQSGPQIDTSTPTISSIAESPSSGDLNAGKTVTYTITLSEAVTVNTSAGTPTLSLNDGGTATYTGGSGSSALTFSYTATAGQNTRDLMTTAVNLNGATIADGAGNAANLSLSGITQGSPQIDTTAPTISSIADSPSSGDLNAGKTVTLTLTMSEAVTVAGGTPTLSLNDGGTATYTGGSGSSALTFSYTVTAGQNTASLAATAINLNSASITDGAGNAANLSLSGLTQSGPQIDTTAPAAPVIAGDTVSGNTVTLSGTAAANSTITVFDNSTQLGTTPTNSSGAWTYTAGALANGSQSFAATATDSAGNVGAVSSPLAVTLGAFTGNQAGTLSVTNGTTLDITGTVNNTGTIALNAAGNGAELVVAGSATLTGGGKVTLSNNAANAVISNGAPATFNNVNNMISGAGTIGDGNLTLTNKGTINANQTQALLINTGSNAVTNSGVLEASSTGGLSIPTLGYLPNSNNTGGTLSVSNGSLDAKIALLGTYMASSFAMESDNHGGTMVVAEASQTGTQSLLTNPQHANPQHA